MHFGKPFNFDIPPKKKSVDSSKESEKSGIKTKIIIAILALLGISTLAEAQEKANSLSPEELQKLALQAKEIMADSSLTKTNSRAFIEERVQGTMANSWQELTVPGDSIGAFTDSGEVIGRPTEATLISNEAGILFIKEIITPKDESKPIKQERGENNYESNVIIIADTNADGTGDVFGERKITLDKEYTYADFYDALNTKDEGRELKSLKSNLGSKFRKDKVQNNNFWEIAKKAGVIWWINDDLTQEEKGALQLDYSNFLKDLVQKAKQEKGN